MYSFRVKSKLILLRQITQFKLSTLLGNIMACFIMTGEIMDG